MSVPKYETATPFIACFVVMRRGNEIAMVLRKNTSWMDGYYGLPAGKTEWGEPFSAGALREAEEEAGVHIHPQNLRYVHTVHRHSEDSDWVDVYFETSIWEGEPHNAEPDKSEELAWIDLNNLPENVVPPVKDALKHIANGVFYSEYGWDAPV